MEGEQLEDRRSVGASSCNSGDGTDQRVQSLVFMMMMMTEQNKRVLDGTAVRINPIKTQQISKGYKASSTPLFQ